MPALVQNTREYVPVGSVCVYVRARVCVCVCVCVWGGLAELDDTDSVPICILSCALRRRVCGVFSLFFFLFSGWGKRGFFCVCLLVFSPTDPDATTGFSGGAGCGVGGWTGHGNVCTRRRW